MEGGYNLEEGVTFKHHVNTLSDTFEEVQDSLRIQERLRFQTP